MSFIKKSEKETTNTSGCCGVDIKEVENTTEESCCGTSSNETSCCN